jgi:hypothetical protein
VLRRASFVSVLLLVLVACSSVPDLRFTDDGINPDGGTDSGREGGIDGGADTAPPCVKTGAEVCDDDIDNDCNGLKDCADPACGTGFACTTPAPDGWTLIAFAEIATAALVCPAGYTGSTDLRVLNGSATHACPCTCTGSGGSGPTCAGATTTIGIDDENTCNAPAGTATVTSNQAACTPLASAISIPGGADTPFGTLTVPAGPASCSASASLTKTDPTDGRSCVAPTKAGSGCSGTNKCVPKASGFDFCIYKDGVQACPTGFTARQRRAGTTSNDTRMCATCNCTLSACSGAEVSLFSNATCGATAKTAKVTGAACAASVGDKGFSATHFKSAITGGCGAPAPGSLLLGELTFGGERTICCK